MDWVDLGVNAADALELDFGKIQSMFNANALDLRLQPDGGNVGINIPFPDNISHTFEVDGSVGITHGLFHVDDITIMVELLWSTSFSSTY